MVVMLLAAASSVHTMRWARGLSAAGIEVHLVSQHPLLEEIGSGVSVHITSFRGVAGYLTMIPWVKKLLREVRPDLVNAHYASGYATTARFLMYRPWLLSVWGSDVYLFPYKSILHKWLIVANLESADAVASTSHCMAVQVKKVAPEIRDVYITPFGVDIESFALTISNKADSEKSDQLVVGTVKGLSHVYGIDILIRAFALVKKSLGEAGAKSVLLRLVGSGPDADSLKQLAESLGVGESVTFVGYVCPADVPVELNRMDVFVALSRSESFGVAAIEAGAAGLPVVVSDAEGLSEVVVDGETGLVVPREDPAAAAAAISLLISDGALRKRLGDAGKLHVTEKYSWGACIDNMVDIYQEIIANSKLRDSN